MNLKTYRTAMHDQHAYTQRAQENRCREKTPWSEFTKTPLRVVHSFWRPFHVVYAKAKHHRAQAKSSVCIPTNPGAIIRYVFPSYAEDQALRVAGCESTGIPYHLNPAAKNPYSTASGLFQLLDTWWAGKFNPFDALANTRMAYQLWLGSGGSFARHWAASIGCWS